MMEILWKAIGVVTFGLVPVVGWRVVVGAIRGERFWW